MNSRNEGTSGSSAFAYIGLGSNMGDRERYLRDAVRFLQESAEVRVTGESGLYETDPVGYVDQAQFLNQVVEVSTTLDPERLFERMLDIELRLNRKRDIRWGPRTIDLDLLLFGERSQDSPDLILPHPRMMERAFVLVPLIEVMSLRDPIQVEQWSKQLERMEGKEGVRLWKRTH
ncbi:MULTISPECIES: 2-amino-4-hydroxy-6-hydroxymethyldihydropteridine diphosphokinase [unclassified Paenibacillus]|uniref:2-amino-4-hydroxy-6- hydroxymethyldihydropteridine diphosphokinase n=1 Tax=unclassified Paenibacillus TaxID=185978 RepID=UPI001AE21370|nr:MULTISPECIES: 2-amino-4-hydroxy-6-hydroxymethyldihydropteridine diphosphokinase [unclassified Paenibacillus]MBP1153512.1 2-amino-4-hydroxy-6-hydroxymethyldihydropteridine diphosphokinase [Paenibacillus sp. PvP091]MBP1171105.1 2-amino-4-hydroxy-6-hydroxymethyldihydropteridine diphosphokinase [Paenibacillus sp. PvR098]MBP2442133.1 2-amino-4-hydroxy-6-hydroxymethyldihydropteridine diphosphokinase [Paenibacillus sp. PvP052]